MQMLEKFVLCSNSITTIIIHDQYQIEKHQICCLKISNSRETYSMQLILKEERSISMFILQKALT